MEVTRYDFELLDYDEKIEILFTHGRVCALKIEGSFQINLYHLYGFFVEAWFDSNKFCFEQLTILKGEVHFVIDSNTGLNSYYVD